MLSPLNLQKLQHGRFLIVMIAMLVGLGPLTTDMYLPAFSRIQADFHSNSAMVQLTLSMFMIGYACSQLFWGPVSDRIGRWPAIVCGLIILVLASFACAMATSIESLILFRFFQAFGACAGTVVGRAMVRDLHEGAEAARMLAYVSAVMGLAPAIAPFIGGGLAALFGWQSIFYALMGIGMLILGVHYFAIPETLQKRNPAATKIGPMLGNYARLLQAKDYRYYSAISASCFTGFFCFLSSLPFLLNQNLGYDEQEFGLLFLPSVMGYIFGAWLGGRLVMRYGIHCILAAGLVLTLLSGLVMTCGATFAQEWTLWGQTLAIIGPFFLYTTGMAMVMPQSMAGAAMRWPDMAGTAAALIGFLQMAFSAIGGTLAMQFFDGTSMPLALSVLACGCLTLFSFWRVLHYATPAD